MKKYLISISGPTAVGKTGLSIQLAQHFGAEILSTDSRQLFTGMDIGTAKPTTEEKAGIPHHFLDILSPNEQIDASWFAEKAEKKIHALLEEKDVLILVGGSTLYIDALWYHFNQIPAVPAAIREQVKSEFEEKGLSYLQEEVKQTDPASYAQMDVQNPVRLMRAIEVYRASGKLLSFYRKGRKKKDWPYEWIKIGLTDERERLYKQINQRVLEMADQGLLKEVQALLDKGISPGAQSMQSIGYREVVQHLMGKSDWEATLAMIQQNSRRYAKRQLTWFRKYEDMQWFTPEEHIGIIPWIEQQMSGTD